MNDESEPRWIGVGSTLQAICEVLLRAHCGTDLLLEYLHERAREAGVGSLWELHDPSDAAVYALVILLRLRDDLPALDHLVPPLPDNLAVPELPLETPEEEAAGERWESWLRISDELGIPYDVLREPGDDEPLFGFPSEKGE